MDESDEDYVATNNGRAVVSDRDSSEDFSDSDSSILGDGVSKRTRSRGRSLGRQTRGGPMQSNLKGNSGGYSWEDEYQRTWDIVKDDDDGVGSLQTLVQTLIESRKKKIMKNPSTPFQRGIIRTMIVIIDGSEVMLERDLRPTRFSMMLSLLQEFILEFFDQNPISQMGIVMMRNGIAVRISDVSGLPQYHIDKIRQLKTKQHNRFEPKGDPSLQNSLELARSLLMYNFNNKVNDTQNSKEILIIFGALFTSDPGNIHKTIDNLVKDDIKVKIIGLAAQVAICEEIVRRTNSLKTSSSYINTNYGVIMNESHFKELLMDCVIPLPVSEDFEKKEKKGVPLIKMGFPLKIQPSITSNSSINLNLPLICSCHPDEENESSHLKEAGEAGNGTYSSKKVIGYKCPQCLNKVCQLPTICPICGLMLILSTHLARSYHHLVPLEAYREVPTMEEYESIYCYGCLLKFPPGRKNAESDETNKIELLTSSRYRCGKCQQDFCIDCDVFIHETLHNCPGCENK